MGESDQKFILLNDRVGENIERNLLSLGLSTKSVPIQVLKGEILVALPEQNQPHDSHKIALTGVERKSVRVECPTSELARVTHEEADLLLGISSALERHSIYHERNRLDAGKKIREAAKVYVKVKGLPREVPGVVWYKGPLPTANGTMFGVELTEHKGHGTSNGTFRNHRYFTCPEDSGVFVSLDKLTLKDNLSEHKKSPLLSGSSSSATKFKKGFWRMFGAKVEKNGGKMDQNELISTFKDHVDKRVVTFVGEEVVRGFLRYLGTDEHGTAIAGIELDKRMGYGTGIYHGKQIFHCKRDYAKIAPLDTVIPEKNFDEVSYYEPNGQEKLSQEEDTRKVQQIWQDEVVAKSMVYDNSETKGPKREIRRSNSASSTASSASTDEALKAAGVKSSSKDSFLKEQEKIMAEIQSGSNSRKRDNPENDAELEKLDNSDTIKQNFKEEHFQMAPTKTSRFSQTQLAVTKQPGYLDFYEDKGNRSSYNSAEHSRAALPEVNSEDDGSYSSVLSRGAISPAESFSSWYVGSAVSQRRGSNKDSVSSRSVMEAKGQDVVADCDLEPTKHPVEKVLDETADKMRESRDQLQDINMDTIPPSGTVALGGGHDVVMSGDGGATSSQAMDIPSHSALEVGSMAEIPLSDGRSTRYGVIRWIGHLPELNGKLVAGLELEEEQSACSDGTFGGRRYFTCQAGRGFFVLLQHCRRDSRFCPESPDTTSNSGKAFGSFDSPIVTGIVAPPETMPVGRMRGIQGHHNSCYLDATLFSMFSFTSVFDSLLHRRKDQQDLAEYEQVQTVLKDSIVNPLRRHGFVRADRVLELRKLLDKLGSVTGLINEEKDPEEFLNTLLQQVFKTEPFLHLKYNNRCEGAHFYQVIPEKEEGIEVPTVQSLLEQSFLAADIKLTEVPSCLILQMPRFGSKYKMYEHILLSPVLDVTHLVESVPHDCIACGQNVAAFECKECSRLKLFSSFNRIVGLCKGCNDLLHGHEKRKDHELTPIAIPREYSSFAKEGEVPIQRHEMELFAVVCIQTSHYVAFVKCGSGPSAPWCFFDSMADRKGERNGYNIPSITACPEVGEWLNYSEEKIAYAKREGKIPDLIKRLLGDSYLCMYQNQEVAMYK